MPATSRKIRLYPCYRVCSLDKVNSHNYLSLKQCLGLIVGVLHLPSSQIKRCVVYGTAHDSLTTPGCASHAHRQNRKPSISARHHQPCVLGRNYRRLSREAVTAITGLAPCKNCPRSQRFQTRSPRPPRRPITIELLQRFGLDSLLPRAFYDVLAKTLYHGKTCIPVEVVFFCFSCFAFFLRRVTSGNK